MKATLLTLILAALSLLILAFGPNALAQDYPPFNVHVAPYGNCTESQENAYVRIDYNGGSQDDNTNRQGWAYFTAPVGQVYVYASYGGHGYGCYHTQPEGGSQHYICLNDVFCYLKDKDRALGYRFVDFVFLYD